MEERQIIRRKRVKQDMSLEERLLGAAKAAREKARKLPPGREREMLLRSARDTEAAAQINRWISSPDVKPA